MHHTCVHRARRIEVAPGEVLIAAGCEDRRLMFVVAGSLRAEKLTDKFVCMLDPLLGVHEVRWRGGDR